MEHITKTVDVPLTPAAAFRIFTRDIAAWWPVDTHSIAAGRGGLPSDLTVEPHVGGQIYETGENGTRATWARITRWEDGRALGLDWHVGRDEAEATRVLVLFTPVETGTRVDLTHAGFGAMAERAAAMRDNYDTGWDHVLGRCYAGRCGVVATA
ncbi:SRPBCC domain-containing protein [Roseisalinus antarcticus]|uniref:Activator of Hsp90 ATPase homologue 1/2-like C-terminal domain-containing protein n=1 Tax=Roseisalinus antarcticus TaxID=254357 RepID=A0A1Y5RM39_9RHOB|nr:SRPBCC domain-containing protein [Roseisalinus antarcticus]SLN19665.1 hypothetical protein ROA7023_00475 [Roseisalinus antarcticus]